MSEELYECPTCGEELTIHYEWYDTGNRFIIDVNDAYDGPDYELRIDHTDYATCTHPVTNDVARDYVMDAEQGRAEARAERAYER